MLAGKDWKDFQSCFLEIHRDLGEGPGPSSSPSARISITVGTPAAARVHLLVDKKKITWAKVDPGVD
jgi:hypothetical protein